MLSWETRRKADQVSAFDPVLSTFSIFETTIALNGAQGTIIPINCAVREHIQNASIGRHNVRNIGTAPMRKNAQCGTMAITLDSVNFPEQKVNFLKSDAEGLQCNIIRGDMHFLEQYHPNFIFIELFPITDHAWMREMLAKLGYELVETLDDGNCVWRVCLLRERISMHDEEAIELL
jgi:FkbM family methyltransferase